MSTKYRVFCVTEGRFVFFIGNSPPSVCPNNGAHTINLNSINTIPTSLAQIATVVAVTPTVDVSGAPPPTPSAASFAYGATIADLDVSGAATFTNTVSIVGATDISGIVTLHSTAASTNSNNGALIVEGGIGVGGTLSLDGNVNMSVGGGYINLKAGSQPDFLVDGDASGGGWTDLIGQPLIRGNFLRDPIPRNFVGQSFALHFTLYSEVTIPYHIPHEYAPGTDMYVHVHYVNTSSNIITSRFVRWQSEYTYAKGNQSASFQSAVTTIAVQDEVPVGTLKHRIVEIPTPIPASIGLETDGILTIRTRRIPVQGAGVVEYPDYLAVLSIDIHMQISKLTTKNRNYPFYA